MHDTPTLIVACAGSFLIGFFVCLLFKMVVLTPWLRAYFSGGRVSLASILGMRLRGGPVNLLLDAHLALIQSGTASRIQSLEATYIVNKSKIHSADDLIKLVTEQRQRESTDRL